MTRRRGVAYVFVLFSSLMVAVIAIGSVVVTRTTRAGLVPLRDVESAEVLARSALDHAIATATGDADWLANHGNGEWTTWETFGEGEIRRRHVKPPGGTAGAPNDGNIAMIEAEGRVRGTTALVRCLVGETRNPYNALRFVIASESTVSVPTLSSLITQTRSATRAAIHAGGDCELGGTLLADLTLGGVLNVRQVVATHVGTLTEGADARFIPLGAIQEYANVATELPFRSAIDQNVLAPGYNDYEPAAPDPFGVYLIRTGGDPITIRDSRITGTLIVTGGGTVTLAGKLSFSPARLDRPTLLVEGDLVIDFEGISTANTELSLDEAWFGKSFNPPGATFEGSADTDTTDSYPSRVEGLVHATGSVTLKDYSNVRGVIIASGPVTVSGATSLVFDERIANWPPPLYGAVDPTRLRVVEGSFELVRE